MIYRIYIYSGIEAALSLLIYLISLIGGYPQGEVFLYVGMFTLLFITFPFWLISRRTQRKNIEKILKEHKGEGAAKIERKGINPETSNNLRTRKSGLTWGGGNIKGTNASRGNKRGFLNK